MITVNSDRNYCPETHVAKAEKHLAKWGYTSDTARARLDSLLTAAKLRPGYGESLAWYATARVDCEKLAARYGVTLETAIGAVAACSPQLAWTEPGGKTPNLDVAEQMIYAALLHADIDPVALLDHVDTNKMRNGHGVRQTAPNKLRALLVARGDSPADILRGVKVRNFYNNILEPGADYYCTIDTHMIRAALGDSKKTLGGDTISAIITSPRCKAIDTVGTVGTYPLFADDMRAVAKAHGLTANAAQAAIWITWRELT